MKVAFFTYPSAFQNVGGGEIQLLKTKEYLEKAGATVDFFDTWRHKVESYELLHIFGSVKDCLGLAQTAKSRDVAVAVSPVFWSDFQRAFFTEGSLPEKATLALRHLTKLVWPSFPSSRRKLLEAADVVLPNSEMERRQLSRLFALPLEKIKVVYNAVDGSFALAKPDLFISRHGAAPFILSIGRIEPRKNQLNLIRADKGIPGKRLVLIGSSVSGYEAYDAQCRQEGKDFTVFLPTLPHEDPFLASAYAACEIFVLPGWFETPGLAALEAALAGSRLVVTRGGSTEEYFNKHVEYVNPADVGDIRTKITEALKRPRSETVKRFVQENFTWQRTAEETLKAYQSILSSR